MADGDGGIVDSVLSSGGGSSAGGYGSGLVGGILDAAIGPVMSNVNYIRSKSPTNRQTGYAKFMAENAPEWAMEGLRRAGVNPILAFGRGPFGGGDAPPMVNARGEARSEISQALARGVSSAKQSSLMGSQLELIQEQGRKAKNEADASEHLTTKINAEIGEILARQGLLDQEIQTQPWTRARSAAEARLTDTRNTVERLGIPWSAEQKRWAQESPVGSISRAIKKVISGGAEIGSRAFRGKTEGFFRPQSEVEDEKYGE